MWNNKENKTWKHNQSFNSYNLNVTLFKSWYMNDSLKQYLIYIYIFRQYFLNCFPSKQTKTIDSPNPNNK